MGDDVVGDGCFQTVSISIHVPRMGDDQTMRATIENNIMISIHVPRMGDDEKRAKKNIFPRSISIHVPRMGDDTWT